MSDDWEKIYWQNRERQMAAQKQGRQNDWQDVDPVSNLVNKIMGGATQSQQPQQSGGSAVMIRPGAPIYRALNSQGFGSTTPLVVKCGEMTENNEFALMAPCVCYLIEDMSTIDLGKMDPKRMVELVQVKSPFTGTLLVEASSIIHKNSASQNHGRQVLKG